MEHQGTPGQSSGSHLSYPAGESIAWQSATGSACLRSASLTCAMWGEALPNAARHQRRRTATENSHQRARGGGSSADHQWTRLAKHQLTTTAERDWPAPLRKAHKLESHCWEGRDDRILRPQASTKEGVGRNGPRTDPCHSLSVITRYFEPCNTDLHQRTAACRTSINGSQLA